MRRSKLRNILSVVVTEHDPDTGALTQQSWRIDLRTVPADGAALLRRAILRAIPTIAQTAQQLPVHDNRLRNAIDGDHDGYPASSSHCGQRGTDQADAVATTVENRLADDRLTPVHNCATQLDTTIRATHQLHLALRNLERT